MKKLAKLGLGLLLGGTLVVVLNSFRTPQAEAATFYPGLTAAQVTNIVNGILGGGTFPANAAGALTNNGSGTKGWYNLYAPLPANNVWSGSNYFGGAFNTATNSCTGAPDFAKPASFYSTNAAFTFAAPINVDPSKKTDTWIAIYVTNTTAAAVAITAPASCHPNGVAYVTNLSIVWFETYGGLFTNMIVNPIF